MKDTAISFILLLAVEAIMAVVQYLRDKLMEHMHRDTRHSDFDPDMA